MSYHGNGPYRSYMPGQAAYGHSEQTWASQTHPRHLPTHSASHQPLAPTILQNTVTLSMQQQPAQALATLEGKEKTRKPIDPPPVVKLDVDERADPNRMFLYSPHLFVIAALIPEAGEHPDPRCQKTMIGETTSTIHRLKNIEGKEGGYFVFGDISVKKPGRYRLLFSLYNKDVSKGYMFVAEVSSNTFSVYSQKDFHGMEESTPLSRSFNDQGVRLRMRKEPRKRQVAGYQPEVDSEHADARYLLPSDCQQMPHRYMPQNLYALDDRSMKRRREDDVETETPVQQLARTNYYSNPYTTQGQAPQQAQHYITMALPTQTYSVQHTLPQTSYQPPPLPGHPYSNGTYNNLDPDMYR